MSNNILQIGSRAGCLEVIEVYKPRGAKRNRVLCRCTLCGLVKDRSLETVYITAKKGDPLSGCMACTRKSSRSDDEGPALNKWYYSCKSNAVSRGLSFELSREEWAGIVKNNCFYCGSLPEIKTGREEWHLSVRLSGVDRINNDMGYTTDNCVACCRSCNMAKRDMSFNDWKMWCVNMSNSQWWDDKDKIR